MEGTRENPFCYHGLVLKLAELTSQSTHKTVIHTHHYWKELYRAGNIKLKSKIYKGAQIIIEHDGVVYNEIHKQPINGTYFLMCDGIKFPIEKKFDKIEVRLTMYKNPSEFGFPVYPAGSYKDSLGGGWYSMVPMYKVNNFYYALMECSH